MFIEDLKESIYIHDIESAPSQFKSSILTLIRRSNEFTLAHSDYPLPDGINLYFGRGRSLPSQPNTIVIGNKYYNKDSQYRILKGKVSTIKTFRDTAALAGKEFIAKKLTGSRQQGQLINRAPDDESDYIFQPLINIIEEYRVVTYYMNGEYHVSGVYAKSGSNASFRNVSNSSVGKTSIQIAIKATSILGYGVSGTDIALVSIDNTDDLNLTESIIGKLSSLGGAALGSISNADSLLNDNHMVLLECNSYPSLGNPMILYDFVSSIKKNRK